MKTFDLWGFKKSPKCVVLDIKHNDPHDNIWASTSYTVLARSLVQVVWSTR